MDIKNLIVVLRGANSLNPSHRDASEKWLYEFQYCPNHLTLLLEIILDGSCDMDVRQTAMTHFKNSIANNWSPHQPSVEQPRNVLAEKKMVQKNIVFVAQVPPVLREQLGECLKMIIQMDYPKKWPTLLPWVKHNLQELQPYDALFVLSLLAQKYQFENGERRRPLNRIIVETFPHLLNTFRSLVLYSNPSIPVADKIKLVCKIFLSSIYQEIPRSLLDDPIFFNEWMILFFKVVERHADLEGPSVDAEQRTAWGWWKVKKWVIIVFNHLSIRSGDNRTFVYERNILDCYLNLLGGYLPAEVSILIFQYLCNSVSESNKYKLLQPKLDVILFELVFPIICFNDDDKMLWDEDPSEYVRKGYDKDQRSPRSAAIDFIIELMYNHGEENFPKFISFIVEIFKRCDEEGPGHRPYRMKDSGLHAIGTLCDTLTKTEIFKSELEHMLVRYVYPEFSSPVGHLRAKAAWVAGKYARISFSNPNNFTEALRCVVAGMNDPNLPVRFHSAYALRIFVETCKDLNVIKAVLSPLLKVAISGVFKLIKDVKNEENIFTLEAILDKLGEDIAPYSVRLCRKLCIKTVKLDHGYEPGASVASGCLRAIHTVLKSVVRCPLKYQHIEPKLLHMMRRMLASDEKKFFFETLDIVSHITSFAPEISSEMWSLWPLLMKALMDRAFFRFGKILKTLGNYISRGTSHFLTCKAPDYQQSLWVLLSSIMEDRKLSDDMIEEAPKLIETLFLCCRGKVDRWVEPYVRISIKRLRSARTPLLKCLLVQVVANALYYNPSLTLSILLKLDAAFEIFDIWLKLLEETENGRMANFRMDHDKKVCCLGLTSLLTLPAGQMPRKIMKQAYKAILNLLVAYENQVPEVEMVDEADEDTDDESDGEEDSDDVNDISNKDEERDLPIDEVDPFVLYMDAVRDLEASDPSRLQNLNQTLDQHYQTLANLVAQHVTEIMTQMEQAQENKASDNVP